MREKSNSSDTSITAAALLLSPVPVTAAAIARLGVTALQSALHCMLLSSACVCACVYVLSSHDMILANVALPKAKHKD